MNLLSPKFRVVFDPSTVPDPDKVELLYFFDCEEQPVNPAAARQCVQDVLDSSILGAAGMRTSRYLSDADSLKLKGSPAAFRDTLASRNINYVGVVHHAPVIWGHRLSNGVPMQIARVVASALYDAMTGIKFPSSGASALALVRNRFDQFMRDAQGRGLCPSFNYVSDFEHIHSLLIRIPFPSFGTFSEGMHEIRVTFSDNTLRFEVSPSARFLLDVFDI